MKIATSPFVYWGVAVFMPEKVGNLQEKRRQSEAALAHEQPCRRPQDSRPHPHSPPTRGSGSKYPRGLKGAGWGVAPRYP